MTNAEGFQNLEEAVSIEIKRALKGTELALRRAVGDDEPATTEERFNAVAETLVTLANASIGLARVVDRLLRMMEEGEGHGGPPQG